MAGPEQHSDREDVQMELLTPIRSAESRSGSGRKREPEPAISSPESSHNRSFRDSIQDAKHANKVGGSDRTSWTDDWWVWEISGLILAAGILIAIIVILRVYDDKEQPSWNYISLNTLLSWLSTLGKGCILFPVSQGLSQLKWVWFAERTRPLSDLTTFDNASRGFYGSAQMLWTMRVRHFAVFGGMAVLLALGFDPFIQNLVHYYPSNVEDASQVALLANSSDFYSVGPSILGIGSYYVDPTLKANVYNSLFSSDQSKSWSIPQYTCSSGNCTWDPTALLAMRAYCSDISSHLETQCVKQNISGLEGVQYTNCTVSLPLNGTAAWYSTNEETQVIAMKVESNAYTNFTPLVYTNATFPVIQFLLASGSNTVSATSVATTIIQNATYIATECTLQPIVRSIQGSVNGSVYHETILAEWVQTGVATVSSPYSLSPNWNDSLGMQPGQEFNISYDAQHSLQDFVSTIFSGYLEASNMEFGFYSSKGRSSLEFYAASDTLEALFYGNMTDCASLTSDRLRCAMDNAADAITKSFRDQAFQDNDPNVSAGRTMVSVTKVKIHWQWLTLPLIVWILSAVTWLGVMWKTRRARVQKWRDNPLPLLFLYREGSDMKDEERAGVSGEAYTRRAEGIQARLYTEDEEAWFARGDRAL